MKHQIAALKAAQRELAAMGGGIGCAVIVILIAMFVGSAAVSAYVESSSGKGGKAVAGMVICGLFVIGAIGAIISSLNKKASKRRESGGNPDQLLKERNTLLAEAQQQTKAIEEQEAALLKGIMRSLGLETHQAIVAELVAGQLSAHWYCEQFRERVDLFQSDIPKSLRIDPFDITEGDLEGLYAEFVEEKIQGSVADEFERAQLPPEQGAFEISVAQHRALLAQSSEPKSFNVILEVCPLDKRISVIKALREVKPELGLAEAKDVVEGAPQTVLSGLSQEEAEGASSVLESAGAEVRLEQD